MISLQETCNKAEKQLKAIRESMDATGCYHPEDASLYDGLNQADTSEIRQLLNSMSLAEFIAKSGTTGIQGAAYLVAAKLHDELIFKSQETDIVPLISRTPMASQWQGGDLQVNVVHPQSFKAYEFSSGGALPTSTINVKGITCKMKSFGMPVPITNDMIEDNQYDLMQYHIDNAATMMGQFATELALTVMKTATDGWGTVNGGASGDAAATKYQGATDVDVIQAVQEVGADRWVADTMVITPEAWTHSVETTGPAAVLPIWSAPPPAKGFHIRIGNLDTLLSTSDALHYSLDAVGTFTRCVTIVFDRENALFTGRKRWLEIKNYADPIRDLSKIVISARQGSITMNDDAIAVITETA